MPGLGINISFGLLKKFGKFPVFKHFSKSFANNFVRDLWANISALFGVKAFASIDLIFRFWSLLCLPNAWTFASLRRIPLLEI